MHGGADDAPPCNTFGFTGESIMKKIWLRSLLLTTCLLVSFQAVHSQEATTTSYIVVTLEDIVFEANSDEHFQLMLGSVAASGFRIQKNIWPSTTPVTLLSDQGLLPNATNAIPLFALPESQLEDQLGFILMVVDNRIQDQSQADDWLQQSFPTAVETASGPVALWSTNSNILSETTASRIDEIVEPLLGGNKLLGISAIRFSSDEDWGVREEVYQTTVEAETSFTLTYRISRVEVPENIEVKVLLEDMSVTENLEQVVIDSQASTAFSGETLNRLHRLLPFEGSYKIESDNPLLVNEVLLTGPIGPFLYLDVGINSDNFKSNLIFTQLIASIEFPFEITLTDESLGIDLKFRVEANFIGE